MYKYGKITVEAVCGIIVALCTVLMVYKEMKRSLIAVVDCGQWKAPQSVVTELKAMDGKRRRSIDPNRMTGVDANNVCSFYLVNIRNTGKNITVNPQMTIPTALYWEVSCNEGKETKDYSKTELITLPEIQGGRHVDVKVWAACDATRSHAKEMKITQDHGYPARKDIRTPVWSCVQCLSQHMSKVKTCVLFLLGFGVALILIKKTPIQKIYLRWKQ